MKRFGMGLLIAAVGLLTFAGSAMAWPADPPVRATISGPDISGQVAITDPAILSGLALGNIEDLNSEIARPAASPQGYTINRWFEGGTFHFGTITYYPESGGQGGYVHFEDGPEITSSHTPYHDRWFTVRPEGNAIISRLIAQKANGGALSQINRTSIWVVAAIIMAAALGAVWLARRRANTVRAGADAAGRAR